MNQDYKTDTAINTYARWRPILKPIARLVIAAQVALALQPLSVLAQEAGSAPYNPVAQAQIQRLAEWNQNIEMAKATRGKSPADHVSDKLLKAQELVAQLRSAHTPGKAEKHQQLKTLLSEINSGAGDVRAEFAAIRADLVKKNLPAEILARHDEAVGQFEQRAATFAQIVAANFGDDDRVARLAEFFDRFPNKRKPAKFDPKKLPWSTPQPNKRTPAETQTAWYQNLYGDQKVRLAQAGGASIGPLQFTTPPEPGQAPTTGDLAETDEVQITPEIRAKALELGNNPVNIYNWVRNNIEWVPTAGAIQSAQDTMEKKRGNATDTASLLIALLRAAKVPARYQWGTIDVEAAKVQNWVGGVSGTSAALQLLNQGGIAARGVSVAGRFAGVRMEHVWVQAYVNWTPARGSRDGSAAQHPNPNAALNAWVPLDASYKQYEYATGMNLSAQAPVDAAAFVAGVSQGATINAEQGWVLNLNQAAIKAQVDDYQNRVRASVAASGTGTASTVGDVIGKKLLPVEVQALLPGAMPNAVALTGPQGSAVPSNLQHRFTYRLYASQYDQSEDSPLLSFTDKTSRLVGKRVTLAYLPATQADADTLSSFMPQPHADGSPINAGELPTSLPAYLIRLKPRIFVDGQPVADGTQSVQMGTDLYSTGGFTQLYDTSQWDLTSEESNVAGQTTAIGISATGISGAQLARLRTRVAAAEAVLRGGSADAIRGVSGEQVAGDLLTATLWTWFAAAETDSQLSQRNSAMVETSGLSYGLFHAVANPVYSWGVVRKVTFPGLNVDIGHMRIITWAKDNDEKRWIAYNRMRGQYLSALEHSVPEKIFNDPAKCYVAGHPASSPALPPCTEGISAVKALGIAAQAGQKIFTITSAVYQSNPEIVSAQLWAHSDSTKQRIGQALQAGYEVTIHESPIAQNGWVGAGFTVIDPSTGTGGYLIEGGANGAWFAALSILFWLFGLVMVGTPIGLWAILLSFVSGLLATIYNCSEVGGLTLGLLIASQTIFTLLGLTIALLLTTIFAGAALIVALLISSIIMRLFSTLMMEHQMALAGCR